MGQFNVAGGLIITFGSVPTERKRTGAGVPQMPSVAFSPRRKQPAGGKQHKAKELQPHCGTVQEPLLVVSRIGC